MGHPARKISLNAEKRLEEVSLSLDGKRLVFVFENGEGYSVPRSDLPGDDGTPITSIEIFDHRCAASIQQSSGNVYDLPWDSIKHYAGGGRQKKTQIGQRLVKVRKNLGLTQEALSRAAGISRMQLARLEQNTSSPNLDTLLRLSRALGTSFRDLM